MQGMDAMKSAADGSGATQVFELPFPPSLNHYYRRVGLRTLISREGRRYRREVMALLAAGRARRMRSRLEVVVRLYPPDRRRRDLDNLQKALLDALEHAGVYADDGQIDRIVLERGPVASGGKVLVHITEEP
jgi:crossover junction endodeoxyribonuclease RusA